MVIECGSEKFKEKEKQEDWSNDAETFESETGVSVPYAQIDRFIKAFVAYKFVPRPNMDKQMYFPPSCCPPESHFFSSREVQESLSEICKNFEGGPRGLRHFKIRDIYQRNSFASKMIAIFIVGLSLPVWSALYKEPIPPWYGRIRSFQTLFGILGGKR
jgi:hypothetical protein